MQKRWAILATIIAIAAVVIVGVVGYALNTAIGAPEAPVARGSYSTFWAYATYSATISTTAINVISFTDILTDLATANAAVVGARVAGVMYTLDASRPTSDTGILLPVDSSMTVMGVNVRRLVFVRENITDSIVTVVLEK